MVIFLTQQSIYSGTERKAQLNISSDNSSGWNKNICDFVRKKEGNFINLHNYFNL